MGFALSKFQQLDAIFDARPETGGTRGGVRALLVEAVPPEVTEIIGYHQGGKRLCVCTG
jgi:hypothetical protein